MTCSPEEAADKAGMESAVRYLASTGCRSLAYINANDTPSNRLKKEGVVSASSALGLECVFRDTADSFEGGEEATLALLDGMLASLADAIQEGDIVVLSGSLPKGAPVATYETWCRTCTAAGAKVFLDADGDALSHGLKALPHLAKPNDAELSRICGRRLEDVTEIAGEARAIVERGVSRVVVSMGGAGALFAESGRTLLAHSPKVPVGSTVGAGDSVVAALAFAEERGMSLEDTALLAMATGAANVMQSGTQAAERELVDSLLDRVSLEEL